MGATGTIATDGVALSTVDGLLGSQVNKQAHSEERPGYGPPNPFLIVAAVLAGEGKCRRGEMTASTFLFF